MRRALYHPLAALAVAFLTSSSAAPGQPGQCWPAGRPDGPAGGYYDAPLQWPLFPAQAGSGSGSVGGVGPVLVVPVVHFPSPVPHPEPAGGSHLPQCPCDAPTHGDHSDGKVEGGPTPPPYNHHPDGGAALGGGGGEEPLSYGEDDDSALPPRLQSIFSSHELVEEFRAQTPRAPSLPPMLLSGFDVSERARVPDGGLAASPPGVHRPRGERAARRGAQHEPAAGAPPPRYDPDSVRVIRGQVTVHRADYTEPYTAWYDERSGAARVDFHGGATSTFRAAASDGRVRRTAVWAQRSGSAGMRRCATAESSRDPAAGRHPALPDLTEFTFAGNEESTSGPVEVWQRTVHGRAGEHGAARGEVLTTRHVMRLARANASADAVPLRYTVVVDSSALGPDCDGYEHVYQVDPSPPLPPKFFEVDLDKLCDEVENLDPSSEEDMAKLDPLREFTLPHRDMRYDQVFNKYRTEYSRQYADEREQAVRKNVIVQNSRFAAAGNRQGATAELGTTLLADRLRTEVRRMMGAKGAAAALADGPERESFPYSRDDVRSQERRLPSDFDWRARGAVSPVGFQGFNCSSCWAFAVSGAVEGALFRRTRRLVPLSYQCLVDCAHPFGGKGCSGTWPSHAYNYVQERGLPALDEYPPYKEKVDRCAEQRVPSQTRISGHVNVTSNSVPALKLAIKKHAPSVVIVDAECQSFLLYKKGVLYDDRCGKELKQLHHAVLAVGWGERRGEPHFILKNSWSTKWGNKGYIRVHARSNTCGVLTMPSYPLLEDGDVRQPQRKHKID